MIGKIPGRPEGRPGVWLIDPATAVSLLTAVEGDTVHNFIGYTGILVGAGWSKESAIDHVQQPGLRLALVFSGQHMRHHLVALNDKERWAFDIGPITEDVMECAEGVHE